MPDSFFLGSLLADRSGFAPDAILRHPFSSEPVTGEAAIRAALEDLAAALGAAPEVMVTLPGQAEAAVVWTAQCDGHPIEGVTLALFRADGRLRELRLLARPFPRLGPWRDRALRTAASADGWELPAGVDRSIPPPVPGEEVDPHFVFPLADDIVFKSPILLRPVEGADRVRLVVGHAAAVYGDRAVSVRLMNGPFALNAWTGQTSGLPMEMAALVRFGDDRRARELTVFMQPWPAAALFRDRVRARLEGVLDASWFEVPATRADAVRRYLEAQPPPIAKLLGFAPVSIDAGRVAFEMAVDERYANPMGTLHGGVVCDLADAAMGIAMSTTLDDGETFTTLDLNAKFFKPVWRATLRATAEVTRRTKTLGLVECAVTDERGSLVAKTFSTCMVLRGADATGR